MARVTFTVRNSKGKVLKVGRPRKFGSKKSMRRK